MMRLAGVACRGGLTINLHALVDGKSGPPVILGPITPATARCCQSFEARLYLPRGGPGRGRPGRTRTRPEPTPCAAGRRGPCCRPAGLGSDGQCAVFHRCGINLSSPEPADQSGYRRRKGGRSIRPVGSDRKLTGSATSAIDPALDGSSGFWP